MDKIEDRRTAQSAEETADSPPAAATPWPSSPTDEAVDEGARPSVKYGAPSAMQIVLTNADRAFGARLAGDIARKYGEDGLNDATVVIEASGTAGQSFGAFATRGMLLVLEGDANDYVGKGLSGGVLAIRPPARSSFKAHENVIVGNTCLYGATSGKAFFAAAHAEKSVAIVLVGHSVVGINGDRGLELALGARPIPVVVGVDGEQGNVSFGERVIEREGFDRGGLGSRVGHSRGGEVVEALELIAACECGVGAAITGVDEDGVVEQADGLDERLLGAAAGKELGLHVVAVGLRMNSIGCGNGLDWISAELGKEGVGDKLGDRRFGGKNIGIVGVQIA